MAAAAAYRLSRGDFLATDVNGENVIWRVTAVDEDQNSASIESLDHRRQLRQTIHCFTEDCPLTSVDRQVEMALHRLDAVKRFETIGLASAPVVADGNCFPTAAGRQLHPEQSAQAVKTGVVQYLRDNQALASTVESMYFGPNEHFQDHLGKLEQMQCPAWFQDWSVYAFAKAFQRDVTVFLLHSPIDKDTQQAVFSRTDTGKQGRAVCYACSNAGSADDMLLFTFVSNASGQNGHYEPAFLKDGFSLERVLKEFDQEEYVLEEFSN